MRFGLFAKSLVVMVVLAIVPVLFFAYRAVTVSEQSIETSVLELNTKLAEKLAIQIDSYFIFTDRQMVFLFASLQKNLTWEDKSELLRTSMAVDADIKEISFLTEAGREILRFPDASAGAVPANRAEEPGFKQYLATRKRTLWLKADPPGVEIFYPLQNNLAGRVQLSLEKLADNIASESVGGTGFAVLIGKSGEPLYYAKDRLDEAVTKEMPQWPLVQSALKAPGVVSETIAGKDLIGAAQSLGTIGGAILILQARSEAYASVAAMKQSSLIALIIVAVGAVLGAAFLAKRLTKPLLELSKAAQAIAQGQFDTQVKINTRDELRDLADTFNQMTMQLKTYAEMQVDKLVVAQQKTDAILFSIADGILMTDAEDAVQLVNRRARELLGVAQDAEINGKPVPEAIPASKLREAVSKGVGGGKGFVDVDLSTPTTRKFMRLTQQPVFSSRTKEILGLVTGLHDATVEKELDRMKDDFMRNITADIRTPLITASQRTQSLMRGADGPLTDNQKRSLSILSQALTMQMLSISNAYDIATIDSGKLPVKLAPARISDIASRAAAMLQPLAAEKSLAVAVDGVGAEPPIPIDANMIEKVLTNLIVNAIKYTAAGGVRVGFADAGAALQITVADSGVGIPANYLQKVFHKFERVPDVPGAGVGLGLAVAKSFVEAHRGKIWAESQPQKGSRFIFTIPKNLSTDAKGEVTSR
ncbi:MAG: HAMP domain-containing protein [Elusimicrobia bacterium]|nr:HAMP domain-containing protein [Elusimicrobiota bacterium]